MTLWLSLAFLSPQSGPTSQFVVNVFQDDPGDLYQGQDECSEGERPGVVTIERCIIQRQSRNPQKSQTQFLDCLGLPECADEGRAQGEGGDVLWLSEGPVEGGKGSSHDTLAQGQHPVEGPEEPQDTVDLQVEDGALYQACGCVALEDAPLPWAGAVRLVLGWGVGGEATMKLAPHSSVKGVK